MFVVKECPICGNASFKNIFMAVDHTASKETFPIIECNSCHLRITSPRPSEDNLGRYYQSEKYISHSEKSASIFDNVYRVARRLTLSWKLSLIKKYTLTKQPIVLDYGCGTGDFLQRCKQKGLSIYGVEPSPSARGIAIEKTSANIAQDISAITTKADIVTLWHVLEHLPDPNYILQTLQERLNDNGTIFIAVPNYLSYDAQKYQQHWAAYDVPRHLWHFTPDNIKSLLEKNNLTQVNKIPMILDAYYVSMLSETYRQTKTKLLSSAKGVMTGLKSNSNARKNNNNYSSLIYIARKNESA